MLETEPQAVEVGPCWVVVVVGVLALGEEVGVPWKVGEGVETPP